MDEQVAASVRAMWSLGDYDRLAARFAPAADRIADVVGEGRRRPALDVAAGTGTLALALARRGWEVTASDLTPALIEQGRRNTAAAGMDVGWHEASLDDLPFDDGAYELVASSFGLIFAPDPPAALREMARLLCPGGGLAFTAWTSSGYMGQMNDAAAEVLPSVPSVTDPFQWGDAEVTAGWLVDGFVDVETQLLSLPWEFASVAEAAGFMFDNSPAHVATLAIAGERADAVRAAVSEHLRSLAEPDGTIRIAAEYVLTTATRE